MSRSPVVAAALLVLAACAAGPDYRAPETTAGDAYLPGRPVQETVSVPGPAGAAQHFEYGSPADLSAWWSRFGEGELSALIDRAFAGNFDLQAARARLRQAQHLLRAVNGARYPQVAVSAGATRQRASGVAAGTGRTGSAPAGTGSAAAGTGGGFSGGDSALDIYTAAGVVSYNLDVAGGVLRRIEEQAARADGARHAVQAASLALAGNIVASAIEAARLAAQIDARQSLIEAQRRRLSLIEAQVDAGAAAGAERVSARADLATALAPLPSLEQASVQARHRLALLLGEAPAGFEPADFTLDGLRLPTELPVRLPAALVRMRPDIRAAESALQAASAAIGVAAADLYPRITLDASYGRIGVDAGSGASFAPLWSLGASLLAPIFEGGRLRAQRDAAVAAYDAALAEYRQTVLEAFTQVADELRALENDARTLAAQRDAFVATGESLDLASFRFEQGVTSYLEVLVAQQQHQQAVIGYVDARAARLSDTARLFAALGGAALEPVPPAMPRGQAQR